MKAAIRLGIGIAIGRSLYHMLCFGTGLWACAVLGSLLVHQWLVAGILLLTGWGMNRLIWRHIG